MRVALDKLEADVGSEIMQYPCADSSVAMLPVRDIYEEKYSYNKHKWSHIT
jgi:hypothetical protein